MIADPKRLFDEDDAELSAAIGAARRRVPSRDRMSAMAGRLAQLGVAVPPEFRPELTASEMPAAVTASGAVSKGTVVALGVAGAALIGVFAWIGLGSGTQPPPVVVTQAPARTTPALPAPNAVGDSAPRMETAGTTPAESELPSPAAVPPVEATARAGSSAASVPGRKVGEASPQVSEIDLLKRARTALSSEPSQSLQLVEKARQSFPRSSFGQEREFIAISALYKLGRRAEAGARERAFRERHPRSAYLPQLDRLSSGP